MKKQFFLLFAAVFAIGTAKLHAAQPMESDQITLSFILHNILAQKELEENRRRQLLYTLLRNYTETFNEGNHRFHSLEGEFQTLWAECIATEQTLEDAELLQELINSYYELNKERLVNDTNEAILLHALYHMQERKLNFMNPRSGKRKKH